MTREVLVNKIQELEEKVDSKEKLRRNLYDQILRLQDQIMKLRKDALNGVYFIPCELTAVITHLMDIKERKLFSVIVYKRDNQKSDNLPNRYACYLINHDDDEKIIIYNNLYCSKKGNLDNQYVLIYDFLQKRINWPYYDDVNYDFGKYQYIEDFICYLSDFQIEKGRKLNFAEMISLADDFAEYKILGKPKQRIKENK